MEFLYLLLKKEHDYDHKYVNMVIIPYGMITCRMTGYIIIQSR